MNLWQHFTLEPYLLHIENTNHRKALTQLRLSSHNLNIELMRPTTPDPNQRLCTLCTNNEIENEEHFIMNCPTYNTQRSELMETCITTCPNITKLNTTHKFIWIMTNEHKIILKALAKFTWLSSELRKHKLRAGSSLVTSQSVQ